MRAFPWIIIRFFTSFGFSRWKFHPPAGNLRDASHPSSRVPLSLSSCKKQSYLRPAFQQDRPFLRRFSRRFLGCDEEVVVKLFLVMRRMRFLENKEIVAKGDVAREVYFLIHGMLAANSKGLPSAVALSFEPPSLLLK